ncbi:hypothetical protein ASE75_06065 [Sphingomonas sp. Leaf17]|uniref:hypothetical protein n=1 Tax=Sphingomonas sp. Leaf17 TaxID=1735683 RepID=UPI0006FEE605|nr:hypothetical protein [Sphingomonas sp. Leaf17]KQM65794.1 hypothetical protein ASE75_06065 [Sphingomonas sp. Leaf17]
MKYIALLGAAYVGGVLRHPHEGAIPVDDSEAKRLVDVEKLAEDVTDGFTKAQLSDATEETISAAAGDISTPPLDNPHLSQAAPVPAPESKPARKGTAPKE